MTRFPFVTQRMQQCACVSASPIGPTTKMFELY